MGSLNDLVLKRDGEPLGGENVQLAALTHQGWTAPQDLKHVMD